MSAPTVADAIRAKGRAAYYWRIYVTDGYYSEPALRVWAQLDQRAEGMLHAAIIGGSPYGRDGYRLRPPAILRRAEAAARQHELGVDVAAGIAAVERIVSREGRRAVAA